MAISLTENDEALLALLRLNARAPVTVLARKLGLSRSTVQDRLQRLEREGVIRGYRVELGEDFLRNRVRALIMIAVEPRSAAQVIAALKRLDGIETLHTVSGEFDLAVGAVAASTDRLDHLLDKVGETRGVVRTQSAVLLSTKIDRR